MKVLQPQPAHPLLRRLDALTRRLDRWSISLSPRAASLSEGVRAAAACALVILLMEVTGQAELSWAAVAALWTCLADPGGPSRARARLLMGYAATSTVFALAGAGAGMLGWAAVIPVVFACTFLGSMGRLYGQAVTQAGLLAAVACVVAADQPFADGWALLRFGLSFVGGALWALVLSLTLWRIHPFRPARRAVGEAFRALAELTADLAALPPMPDAAAGSAWARHARQHRRAVRLAIEAARTALDGALRDRGLVETTGRLLLALEAAERIFARLIVLEDQLEEGASRGAAPASATPVRAMRQLAALLHREARLLTAAEPPGARMEAALAQFEALLGTETSRPGAVPGAASAATPDAATAGSAPGAPPGAPPGTAPGTTPGMIPGTTSGTPPGTPLETPPGTALGLDTLRAVAAELRAMLGAAPLPPSRQPVAVLGWRGALAALRNNLGWGSLVFRHALRSAVLVVVAVLVTRWLHLPQAYWATMAVVLVHQPEIATTWPRAVERAVGSVLGGLLAVLLGWLLPGPTALTLAVFPLAMVTMALRPVSYALFVFFLTPLFVLLVDLSHPGGAQASLAGLRALDNVLGSALALGGALLLWPDRAPHRLRFALADALSANGAYAAAVFGAPGAERDAARRAAGLASTNAETVRERAAREPRRSAAQLEAAASLLTLQRRLAGVSTTAWLQPEAPAPAGFGAWVAAATVAIARALREAQPPATLPPAPGEGALPPSARRTAELLRLMHQAGGRFLA
ncbi:FUSC family protein [Roseomonas elaeocarpi]|uniref:FUSC family protein n=1 Tax=Roseomonas elaeocarpi TaxID=907779 RepID=A0ABV6JW38_9PROT